MSCSQQTCTKTPRPKNGGCCRPPQTGSGTESLSDLMSQWEEHNRSNLRDLLDGYRTSSFPDALKAASHGEFPPNGKKAGKRHPHQRRLAGEALNQWAKTLGRAQAQIQAFRGQAFEGLFDFIDERARTISGIGPLMVYDTALRIGANIGCLPKDWIYLHAHATIPSVHDYHIEKAKLHEALKALEKWEAYEIEDFLCIYHEQVKELMSRS